MGCVTSRESGAEGIVGVGRLVGGLLVAVEELARVERAIEEADEHAEVAPLFVVDLHEHDADLELAEELRAPDDLADETQRLGEPALAELEHELDADLF